MAVDHYENFPVASFLVPRRLQPAVRAIYRFARLADDLADEGSASPSERLAALADVDAALSGIAAGRCPPDAPWPEIAAAIELHALPVALFSALVSAFRQDVTTQRYADFPSLLDYCRRSANPVGRLMLHLYGVDDAKALAHSDAICTGLQLVNFWQDIALDWKLGRIYLPAEDLRRFGVTEAQIASGRTDGGWGALLAFETARTRALLESGRPLTRALPWRAGLELAAVIAGGTRILERIDAVGGDVYARRPRLSGGDWLWVALRACLPSRGARAAA